MSITSVIVLFSVVWFLTFLVILPLRQTTQADAGVITPGTPAGAPHVDTVGAKAKLTTAVAIVVWGLLAALLTSDLISISDFDWTKNLPPVSSN